MKKLFIKTVLFTVLSTGIFACADTYAQSGDPPPPPGEHGSPQNLLPGGGAPLGSGTLLLITLGIGYGLIKKTDSRQVIELSHLDALM